MTSKRDGVRRGGVMKKIVFGVVAMMLLSLIPQVHASEVIPPEVVVEWLIKAYQGGGEKAPQVGWYFKFDEKEHGQLTPLSREEQLWLLKNCPADQLKFDSKTVVLNDGKFILRLLAPKKLDFVFQHYKNKGRIGPPWGYSMVALATAWRMPRNDGLNFSVSTV